MAGRNCRRAAWASCNHRGFRGAVGTLAPAQGWCKGQAGQGCFRRWEGPCAGARVMRQGYRGRGKAGAGSRLARRKGGLRSVPARRSHRGPQPERLGAKCLPAVTSLLRNLDRFRKNPCSRCLYYLLRNQQRATCGLARQTKAFSQERFSLSS
jgi:hypothetical protein